VVAAAVMTIAVHTVVVVIAVVLAVDIRVLAGATQDVFGRLPDGDQGLRCALARVRRIVGQDVDAAVNDGFDAIGGAGTLAAGGGEGTVERALGLVDAFLADRVIALPRFGNALELVLQLVAGSLPFVFRTLLRRRLSVPVFGEGGLDLEQRE